MNSELIGKKIIARIDRAGVFHGTLDHIDNDIVRMTDTRRIYYWNGALSVTDMAANGLTGGKISAPVSKVEFMTGKVVELNECSVEASRIIESIKVWEN